MLTPAAPGAAYASYADLIAADDLPHESLTVWGWKANGAPLVVRVRGLSLEERETVLLAATNRATGMYDLTKLTIGYLRYGLVVPALTDEQAKALAQKHAGTVQQVADYIKALTELDYGQIQAVAEQLAGLGAADAPDTAPATEPGDGNRSLD